MDKASWIASLKPDDHFCTRRSMKCANCGENSLKHDKNAGFCPNMPFPTSKVMKWQPLPPKLKVKAQLHRIGGDVTEEMVKGKKVISLHPHPTHLNPCRFCGELNDLAVEYERNRWLYFCKNRCAMKPTPQQTIGKKYAICSGRGTKAICECGHPEKRHHRGHLWDECIQCKEDNRSFHHEKWRHTYAPLTCELVSVMAEEEWLAELYKTTSRRAQVTRPEIFSIFQWEAAFFEAEAHREGFNSWSELNKWISDHYNGRPRMWRYEFKR